MKPETVSRIIILAACGGVTFNHTTNSAEQSGEAAAKADPRGPNPADPAALGGGHECLHQRQVHAVEAADAGADEEAHQRKIDPAVVRREIEQAGGDGEV